MEKQNISVELVNSKNFKHAHDLNKLGFADMDLSQIIGYSFFKYDNLLLLFDKDGVASSTCCINNQKIKMGDTHLDLAVIGAVTTHPEKREKGFGSILMKESIKIMREEGYDLTLVFPWSIPWYQKFGYNKILTNHKRVTLEDFKNHKPQFEETLKNIYEIRKYNYDTDNNIIEELHSIINIDKFGPIQRGINWTLLQNADDIYVACKNGQVVAFTVANELLREYGKDPYGFKLREGSCFPGDEDALTYLIIEMCKVANSKGFDSLIYDDVYFNLNLPGSSTIPSESIGEYEYFDLQLIKMYKILNNKSVLRKLTPIWNERLGDDICWQDVLTIDYSESELNGKYKLKFVKSNLTISLNEVEYLEVLILGTRNWAQFSSDKDFILTPWEEEKMNTLFPINPTVFWDIDFF